jgi:hypothetical protein
MHNRTPDGKTFQEVIEAALEGQAGVEASQGQPSPGCTVGEVLDTHHPHLPGRVFVRWLTDEHKALEHWLQAERHLRLRKGDRDGSALLTVRQGVSGPELQLGTGNVELKAARTLRLTADTIELHANSGGVDLRTDGDAVLRARTIRLN